MNASRSCVILLVDDDDTVRELCRRGLEAEGAKVIEASDGERALSLVQTWPDPIDLVITDIRMPRIDGRELAEVLSIFRPELPALAMSGHPVYADRRLTTLAKPVPQLAAEMMMRHSALQQRVDLLAVALELQREAGKIR
jgi:CheY-like chemotaxis protein